MAAVVGTMINTGAGPTVVDAEAGGGITFGQSDAKVSLTGTAPPLAAGTIYTWYKTLHLNVSSGGGTTSLLNRQIKIASSPTTGIIMMFKDGADTYTQATDSNNPADNGTTNDVVPATWTGLTTSLQTWDASSEACVNATRNGNFIQLMNGVSFLYAGAGGPITLPNITLQYQEE